MHEKVVLKKSAVHAKLPCAKILIAGLFKREELGLNVELFEFCFTGLNNLWRGCLSFMTESF